jgi:hypothetical protein
MVTIPQTPITESSFRKWRCFKVDIKDDGIEGSDTMGDYWYWVIPLVDTDESNFLKAEDYYPHMWSSENGEFMDDDGNSVYSVFMFDDDLPALTSEEEVEIVYKILTKRDLYE